MFNINGIYTRKQEPKLKKRWAVVAGFIPEALNFQELWIYTKPLKLNNVRSVDVIGNRGFRI